MVMGIPVNGKKLSQLRTGLFTQEEFAKAVGMTKGGIARIEGLSKTGIRIGNFRKICSALNRTEAQLRQELEPDGRTPDPVEEVTEMIRLRAVAEGISELEFMTRVENALKTVKDTVPTHTEAPAVLKIQRHHRKVASKGVPGQ